MDISLAIIYAIMGKFPQTDNVIYCMPVLSHFVFYFIVTPGIFLVAELVGALIQVGRSRVRFPIVSLEFFINIILLATLRPWG